MKEVYLKYLEMQWNDHFHMRNQTWKTLTYTAVFFIGIVGLEIKVANDFVMICLYSLLMIVMVFGWSTASHHRVRQKGKFALGPDNFIVDFLSAELVSSQRDFPLGD